MNNFKDIQVSLDKLAEGIKPIPAQREIIEVEVSTNDLIRDYGRAFVLEAKRRNPLEADRQELTEQELLDYCDFLLYQRVQQVNDQDVPWRQLKLLYIPSFVQYCLTLIGRLEIRDLGITLIPVFSGQPKLSLAEAKTISQKIAAFEDDLCVLQDAMPREVTGNQDVMTTVLIAGYMRSMQKVTHLAATYVSAFLNLKLKQETVFASLFRIQYDDLDYIASALATTRGIF